MYHRIVAAKVRGAFAQISAGNWEPMVSSMAPEFTYRFYGDHALSGERHTHAALRMWWQRSFRILPDARFDVQEVIVSGWPWNTRIATSVIVTAPLPDGSRYENIIHQFLHMRWARITEIRTLEDTVRLQRALDVVAASGNQEAQAPPITDESAAAKACVNAYDSTPASSPPVSVDGQRLASVVQCCPRMISGRA